jgi:hypothetical protein
MRLPTGSYLKLTVPPVPGSVTLLMRFSKSQKYCVVPLEFTFVEVFPLLSSATVQPERQRKYAH